MLKLYKIVIIRTNYCLRHNNLIVILNKVLATIENNDSIVKSFIS